MAQSASPSSTASSRSDMSAIGLLVAAGSLLLLLPLAPFLAVLKAFDRLRGTDLAGELRERASYGGSP